MRKVKLITILTLCHLSSFANIEMDDAAYGFGQMISWVIIISVVFFILKAILGRKKNDTIKDN